METPEPPKQYSNAHYCWLPTRTRWQGSVAKDTTGLGHWTETSQAGPGLEASSSSCRLLGENCHAQSHPAVDPVCSDISQAGQMNLVVRRWKLCYGGHQPSSATEDSDSLDPCSTGRNPHMVLQTQPNPVAGEVIGSRGKTTAAVLVNGHDVSVELPS